MRAHVLPQNELTDWLRRVQEQRRLLAPVPDGQGVVGWREVGDPETIRIEPGAPDLPPKGVFLPPSETLLRYGYRGDRAATLPTVPQPEPFAVFGVRPCDALALQVADAVYLPEPRDPYWAARRAAGLILALNCDQAAEECFCASLNRVLTEAPGSDALVTPLGERYLLEARTEAGAALLEQTAAGLEPASDEDLRRREQVAQRTAAAQTRRVDAEGMAQRLQEAWGDEAFWREQTAACVGCGVCTFLCPTCTCFDVQDDAISGRGVRYRCWDTCQFADFSREAGGHDPRPQQWQRQRNRICHKFWYSVERCGVLSCVGCGRCLRQCGAHSDLTDILAALGSKPVTADE